MSVRTAIVLLAALALVLLLFVVGVALMVWSRSNRRGAALRRKTSAPVDAPDAPDAWTEAGRRARAFPSPPRGPADEPDD